MISSTVVMCVEVFWDVAVVVGIDEEFDVVESVRLGDWYK